MSLLGDTLGWSRELNKSPHQGQPTMTTDKTVEAVAFLTTQHGLMTKSGADRMMVPVEDLGDLLSELTRLQEEVKGLRGALRFYRDAWDQDCDAQLIGPGVWDGGAGEVEPSDALRSDKGEIARAALQGQQS